LLRDDASVAAAAQALDFGGVLLQAGLLLSLNQRYSGVVVPNLSHQQAANVALVNALNHRCVLLAMGEIGLDRSHALHDAAVEHADPSRSDRGCSPLLESASEHAPPLLELEEASDICLRQRELVLNNVRLPDFWN
tara:strand:+ start:428 stop:835 length:408 start_codon:yes stop_codon:yes gene_type:complete